MGQMIDSLLTKGKDYTKKDILISPDEVLRGVFYLKEGYVRMYSISRNGNEVTINIFKPASFFPLISVLADIPNKYYFEVLSKTANLFFVSRNKFLAFAKKNPKFLFEISKKLLVGLYGQSLRIEALSLGTSTERVGLAILIMTKRFGKKGKNGIKIQLKLTHSELAAMAGVARETVTRQLEKLREEKIIDYSRDLIVLTDQKRLENLLVY